MIKERERDEQNSKIKDEKSQLLKENEKMSREVEFLKMCLDEGKEKIKVMDETIDLLMQENHKMKL